METTKPKGSRGRAYLRISSDKQDAASQRKSIQGWLDQRGLAVQVWHEDVGSRDKAGKRQDFQRLLRVVEAGEVDWIVCDVKDRFGARNSHEFGSFVVILQNHDVELWSTTQGELTADDAATEIMAAVDSVRSKDEQKARSQRSIRGQVAAAKKGQWQGGYPPFGYDTICVGPTGQEKWRVFYEASHKRLKIYPPAMKRPPERFDGKGVFPARDPGDVLRLVPSRDKERIRVVRQIFEWFATEAISVRGICTRLNDAGIAPVFGDAWYSTRLGPMLKNPVYWCGVGVWNKQGGSRFYEFVGGGYQEVARTKGKAPAGRKRAEADFIYGDDLAPTPTRHGLITKATWDRVQAKLNSGIRPSRAPRNPDLWLSGLVVCGQCQGLMVGWHQKSDTGCPLSYACAAYRKFGRHNKSGCRLHRTSHRIIEALVNRYLDETGQTIETLLALQLENEFVAALQAESEKTEDQFMRAINATWQAVRGGAKPPAGQAWTSKTLGAAYRESNASRCKLVAKEAELQLALKNFALLTHPVAIAAAEQQAAALSSEVQQLRGQALDLKTDELRSCLAGMSGRLRAAGTGDANRQRAQAVSQAIRRIVCQFRHDTAGQQNRSVLVSVMIEPVVGEMVEYDLRRKNSPARGFAAKLLTRWFDATEIAALRRVSPSLVA